MEPFHAAVLLTFQAQFSTLAHFWPYLKTIVDILHLVLHICLLLTQFTIGWMLELAFESSTIDIVIFLISLGVTTKMLMDAANLEISITWRR